MVRCQLRLVSNADRCARPLILVAWPYPLPLIPKHFIPKDFCRKRLNRRSLFPSVHRQSGFAAGLFKKSRAVPAVLDGNLGQQQATSAMAANEKAVPADFDFFGTELAAGAKERSAEFPN